METFTLLINGKDVDTGNYEYFPYASEAILDFKTTRGVIRELKKGGFPAETDKYVYAKYCIGDEKTCQNAINAAYKASKEYKHFPIEKRRKIMYDIHDLLVKHKNEIIKLFMIEGHPLKLAEWEFEGMEKGFDKKMTDVCKNEIQRKPIRVGSETIHIIRKADGVVCLNSPKNASASNSFVAAGVLYAGNTIVVKPPLRTPLATIYLWKNVVNEALKRNGAPNGCVNIILGNSKNILEEWLKSPLVNDIFHFGASEKGIEIGQRIYLSGKKPILELSGNDLLFVWKDADIKKAANALMDAFLGSTQICMVPKNAIIHEDIFDNFCNQVLKLTEKIKIGLPDDIATPLSPVIKIPEFFEFLQDTKEKGGEILCGGKRVNHKGEEDQRGVYVEPTLVKINNEKDGLTMRCIKEENFFPLLPLLKVSSEPMLPKHNKMAKDDIIFSKMIDISEKNEYGLRISAWITSKKYIDRFIMEVDNSGLLIINSRHIGFSLYIATHGGTKKSGGPLGEMNYIWARSSHLQGVSVTK